jgi:hypothetical protein
MEKEKEKEKEKERNGYRAHCLVLTYPTQGHINPMVQLDLEAFGAQRSKSYTGYHPLHLQHHT